MLVPRQKRLLPERQVCHVGKVGFFQKTAKSHMVPFAALTCYLVSELPMDTLTYTKVSKISSSWPIGHYYFPSHNLLSVETLLEVSKDLNSDEPDDGRDFLGSFPCYQQFPYAVRMSFPLLGGSGDADHARELVEKKQTWEAKLKKMRLSNIDSAIDRVKKLRDNKEVKLSDGLRKYIEHFHNDPEPMFNGYYNWLYTGGCLSCNESFGETTLISADYFNKKPGFHLLQLNKTLDGVEYKSFSCLKTYSPVLQIQSRAQRENLVICVRQKNYLSLYNARREDHLWEPVRLWRKKVVNFKLLTSVDLKENCKEVILTDTNLDIHVFNVERKSKIYSCSGRKTTPVQYKKGWSQAAFGHHGVYWAFKNCFVVLDLREFYSRTKLQYDPTLMGEKCEEICSFVPSSCNSNFVYLGTVHSLFQVDLRNGKTVQKWTHMMKSSPQFITSIEDEGSDVLVLQSQAVGEKSGIVNECRKEGEGVNFVSRSLPCLLMSMLDSLNVAHLNGVCLNPVFRDRVNFFVTGMRCLKNSEGDIVLFTKNSSGDIFLSKIRKKTWEGFDKTENLKEILERMKIYESEVESIPTRDTRDKNLEHVDMRQLPKKASRRKAAKKRPEISWKCEEMYSPESLLMYRDILARKILDVWGHGLEEEEEEQEEVLSVDLKVREWMEKC